jgi:site-specific DNA recombinase
MGNDKVAIYIRVSTEEQKNVGCSLEAQEEELRRYVASNGLTVFDVYCDGGYSGKDFNRPDVQRLFSDMAQNKFQAIVVWRLDRLSRSNQDILNLMGNELQPRNMRLLVSTCGIDSSTTEGKMFISLQGTFAEYERNVTINRVKSGMKKRASNGEFNGGTLLGYDIVNKQLVVNEQESEIVKRIFEMRAEGMGYKTIVNNLNSYGYKTKRGNNFGICAVRLILHNKEYVGMNTWGKKEDWNLKRRKGTLEEMPERNAKHSAIISMEIWEKVQAINELHKSSFTAIKSHSGNYFLAGVVRCPKCGAGMVMHKNKIRGTNDYRRYYMCQAYHQKGRSECSSNLIRADWIEQEVLHVLRESVNSMDLVDEVLNKIEEDVSLDKQPLELRYNELKLQVEKKAKQIDSLDERYLNGEIGSDNYNRLITKAQSELAEVSELLAKTERKVARLNYGSQINSQMVVEVLKDFDSLFEVADDQEKKVLIRSVIKSVHVSTDRKKLERISLWIGDDLSVPASCERRTVSQITAKLKIVKQNIKIRSITGSFFYDSDDE